MDFHFSTLKFYIRFEEDGQIPQHKSSAFRGGMGQMLLRMFCVQPEVWCRDCGECLCKKQCIVQGIMYATFPQQKPMYVTDVESAGFSMSCLDERTQVSKGDIVELDFILYSGMASYFYPILQALHMFGVEGLGKEHVKFSIVEVKNRRDEIIVSGYDIDTNNIQVEKCSDYVNERRNELGDCEHGLKLSFMSPCSIKYQSEFIKEFSPRPVIRAVERRIHMMELFDGADTEEVHIDSLPTEFTQYSEFITEKRFSERKKSNVLLRGIRGWLEIKDVSDELLDVLILGEITKIGKNTKFGFGVYKVEAIK